MLRNMLRRWPAWAVLALMLGVSVPLATAGAQGCTYTTVANDSLAGVSARFGLQAWQLQELNGDRYPTIWDNRFGVGWVLNVPCLNGSSGSAAPAATTTPTEDEAAAPSLGGVTASSRTVLNVRTQPSTEARILTQTAGGAVLPVLGRNADSSWLFIRTGSTEGWIAGWLPVISGDLSTVPVVTQAGSGSAPAGPAGPAAAPAAAGGGTTLMEIGGQTQSFANPGVMQSAGMTWVKFQHKWGPSDSPQVLADRIRNAQAQGFKVLISSPGPEYPSTIEYAAYVNFIAGVAGLGADAVEVWNEMNIDREWPSGQISPTDYVNNMLAPAYLAVKAQNPDTLVISGAPAPTGVDDGINVWSDARYIAGMAEAGAANYMDCVGVHYNAGATSPDAIVGHPAAPGGGHYSWYFIPTLNLYAGTFPNTPLCYTEIGYVSGEGWGPMPPLFAWGSDNTVAEQAEWLGQAAELSRDTGRVRLFIVFNVDFTVFGADPQAGYAIVRPDGSCPACRPLASALR